MPMPGAKSGSRTADGKESTPLPSSLPIGSIWDSTPFWKGAAPPVNWIPRAYLRETSRAGRYSAEPDSAGRRLVMPGILGFLASMETSRNHFSRPSEYPGKDQSFSLLVPLRLRWLCLLFTQDGHTCG